MTQSESPAPGYIVPGNMRRVTRNTAPHPPNDLPKHGPNVACVPDMASLCQLEAFTQSHIKIIFLKIKINPGTFACEISTERIPVGI
jgi:hypothetical protein